LEEFRATAIIGCPRCGTRIPPADVSPDGHSYRYQCPECGATAHFTLRMPA
jgi:DNA-directed RNA polymerase subunit RPC12/RpoP